ncbi:MAG TPA: DUF433 domain-containing protein [Longimicrobiaceae bacterium]|nr:DUF433 domain-containing protein [Longimicrobiaceae bacterium]
MTEQTGLATVNEAAFVAGVSPRAVNQAIDRNEIRTYTPPRKDASGRVLGGAELVYLSLNGLLSSKARKELYRVLAGRELDAVPAVIEMHGDVRLDIGRPLAAVRTRLGMLERIKSLVQVDPEIRGGEPVFRGTRIPVHMIAEFLRKGVPRNEILEDYPSLDVESLEVAAQYAVLYPRRGRPKEAPWRSREPSHRFRREELCG